MRSKSGKLSEIKDVEERLEKIEKNERKSENLCSKVDDLEKSSYNNGGIQVVTIAQPIDVANSQVQQVNAFYV